MTRKIEPNKLISELMVNTPLDRRLRIIFEMSWLEMNIVPDREATDDEIKEAVKWSKIMVDRVMSEIENKRNGLQ